MWRAADLVLDRPVAVKLLRPEYAGHPETLERFRAEAKHAGSLTHPCIARVYDYGNAGPSAPPYLVMEYVNGPSLADMLAVDPVNPVLALDVVAQAAAGLDAARRTAGTRRADHQAHRQGPGGPAGQRRGTRGRRSPAPRHPRRGRVSHWGRVGADRRRPRGGRQPHTRRGRWHGRWVP